MVHDGEAMIGCLSSGPNFPSKMHRSNAMRSGLCKFFGLGIPYGSKRDSVMRREMQSSDIEAQKRGAQLRKLGGRVEIR